MRFSVFVALPWPPSWPAAPALPTPIAPSSSRKLAGEFLEKLKTNAALAKTVKAVQASNGDEAADEGIAKISAMMANTAQKNPKSWPRLRKFAKITLGATVAGLAVYGAYKALFDRNSSGAATTTTTTGSA
ncbi:hypothetical protein GQ600_13635 [Phytophthora cactorum]|nr:hypothetical protein GQ600_13635 [Phytophthora cactorum]